MTQSSRQQSIWDIWWVTFQQQRQREYWHRHLLFYDEGAISICCYHRGKEATFCSRWNIYPAINMQIEMRDDKGDKQTIYATAGRGRQSGSRAGEWVLRSAVSKGMATATILSTILTEASQLRRRKDSLSIWYLTQPGSGARWCVFLPTYICNNQHFNKK